MNTFKQYAIPIFCVILSAMMILFIIDPALKKAKMYKIELADLQATEQKVQSILKIYDNLNDKFKQIDASVLENVNVALPENVNNVKLILALEGIAKSHSMALKDVKVELKDNQNTQQSESQTPDLKKVTIEVSVIGSYDSYLAFMKDVEQSMQLMTFKQVDFKADRATGDQNKAAAQNDIQMTYVTKMETYWFIYSGYTQSQPTTTSNVTQL